MRKSIAIGLAVVAAIVVVGTVAFLSKKPDENPNVKRARELLSSGESDAAVRELRIALKDHPDDRQAKALLLVAVLRNDKDLDDWYELQGLIDTVRRLRGSASGSLPGVAKIESFLKDSRQELYDKGLDTSDADELWEITGRAAAYSFEAATDDEKDHAAFVLALRGDTAALEYLVDRLKSEKATHVPDLLVRLGASAEPLLMKVATSRESLGHRRALDALATLRADQAAGALLASGTSLRGFAASDRPGAMLMDALGGDVVLVTPDQIRYGASLHDAAEAMHFRWIDLDNDGDQRLVSIEAYDQTRGEIVTRFYRFASGTLQALTLEAPPDVRGQLAKEGPIAALTRDGRMIVVQQSGKGSVQVPHEARRAGYKKGDRVRISTVKKAGVVAGSDEFGLLTVTLDEPYRGMHEMSVAPSVVVGLEMVAEDRFGRHVYDGRIENGKFVLRPDAQAWIPSP